MKDLLTSLRLKHLEQGLPTLLEEARVHGLTYEAFLRRVLLLEVEARKQEAQQVRLKAAKLPVHKTLEAFDFSFQPSIAERQLWELAELAFVKTHTNIIFLGPPGVGKTHLAIALGVKALEAGHTVLFRTFAQVAEELATASYPGLLQQRLHRYLRPHLLIIDEVGYTTLTQEQAQQLFAVIRDRYERGSTMLTSNTSFSEWGVLLHDEVLATALLDRLLHHAAVISITGQSYRMKEQLQGAPTKGGRT